MSARRSEAGNEEKVVEGTETGSALGALGKLGTDVPFAVVWLLLSMCTYLFFN